VPQALARQRPSGASRAAGGTEQAELGPQALATASQRCDRWLPGVSLFGRYRLAGMDVDLIGDIRHRADTESRWDEPMDLSGPDALWVERQRAVRAYRRCVAGGTPGQHRTQLVLDALAQRLPGCGGSLLLRPEARQAFVTRPLSAWACELTRRIDAPGLLGSAATTSFGPPCLSSRPGRLTGTDDNG
jgi:hypothetical protein